MVKVPSKTEITSNAKTAVDAGIGAAIVGLTANLLGPELGVIIGSIGAGAAIGGDTGKMITVNGVQDGVTAMFLGGMGGTGEGGSVM